MNVQYLSDAQGRHTAIVIPIEEWNTIAAKHEDLKMLEKPKQDVDRRKPSDFVGCISKETAQEMIADIELSRSEWERRI